MIKLSNNEKITEKLFLETIAAGELVADDGIYKIMKNGDSFRIYQKIDDEIVAISKSYTVAEINDRIWKEAARENERRKKAAEKAAAKAEEKEQRKKEREAMNKNRIIKFRISEEEYQKLYQYAALNSMSISEYIRSLFLK